MTRKKKESTPQEPKYAGFSIRLFASMIDMLLTFFLIAPFFPQGGMPPELIDILHQQQSGGLSEAETNAMIFEFLLAGGGLARAISMRFTEMLVMGVIVVLFWIYRSATPGKMLFGLKIVDSVTGNPPGKIQCIIRYLGYIISGVPLGLGFLWISLNKRRRGWHDYLAHTVVIMDLENTVWQRMMQPFKKYLDRYRKV